MIKWQAIMQLRITFNMQVMIDSNMTFFIHHIHNGKLRFPILFNSYMRIVRQIMDIIPKWFHVIIQDLCA